MVRLLSSFLGCRLHIYVFRHIKQPMPGHLPSPGPGHVCVRPLNVWPSEPRPRLILPTPSPLHSTDPLSSVAPRSRRVGPGEQTIAGRRASTPSVDDDRTGVGGGDSAAGENVAEGGGKVAASGGGEGSEAREEGRKRLGRKHDGSPLLLLTAKKPSASGQKMRDEPTRRRCGRLVERSLAHHYVTAMKSDVSPTLKADRTIGHRSEGERR